MKRIAPLAALLAATGAQAMPTLTTHVPPAVAKHAARLVGAAAPGETMELAISLPLRDEAGLRALIALLYDKASPQYRHYLSVADFTARFGPSAADYDALVAYATAQHLRVHARAANRHVLDVDGSVSDIERALHVRIGLYRHPGEARDF